VRLKKSELIFLIIGSAGGLPPEPPPSARRTCPPLAEKRPFRIGRFQVFRSAIGGTLGFAQFGDKFFFYFN